MSLNKIIDSVKSMWADFTCPVDIYEVKHPTTGELHYVLDGFPARNLDDSLDRDILGTPLKEILSEKLGFSLTQSPYTKIPLSQAKQKNLPNLNSYIQKFPTGTSSYKVVLTQQQRDFDWQKAVDSLPSGGDVTLG
jgi:hypothetical protein